MKKLVSGLLAVVMGACCANAQLLWKVTGPGVKDATYLFGTHHLAPVSMLDSVAGFHEALGGVDAVVGEIDMSVTADAAIMSEVAPMSFAPADSLLSTLLTPAELDSLDAVLHKYMGDMVSARAFDRLKPAALSAQLAMLTAPISPEQAQSIAAGQQLDAVVQTRGREASKEVLGLETLAEQMQILMGNPVAEQARQLVITVRQCLDGSASELSRELYLAYTGQNLAEVERIMLTDSDMTPEELGRLITARNSSWVKLLGKWMPERSMLVAVGCGHLPGPDGLIEQLRGLGYSVDPVK